MSITSPVPSAYDRYDTPLGCRMSRWLETPRKKTLSNILRAAGTEHEKQHSDRIDYPSKDQSYGC